MALENLTVCPICNAAETTLHQTVKDYTVSHELFDIVKCAECSFLYTNPRPTPQSLGSYYKSDDYISHTNKSNNPINLLYKLARTQTIKWKYNLIKKSNPKSLLDYGCGTGHFLQYTKKKGLDIYGIEPDDNAKAIAEKELDAEIFSTRNEVNRTFDTITLWHVLEHIPDINEAMLWLKSHLNKNGQLIIAVPNPNSHDAKIYGAHWAAYDVPRHLYHFTKKTLSALAVKHSFCVESIHPMKLDSYYVSLLSNQQKYNSTKPLSSIINGLKSNTYASKSMNYSSLIYILTHKNA